MGGKLMDVLSDMLNTLRLNATIFLHASFCRSWVVDIGALDISGSFHVVSRGKCWLHLPAETPISLNPGDLIFLPRNAPHLLCESAEPPREETPRNEPAEQVSGPSTTLICGRVDFSEDYWNPLLEALPEYIILPTSESENTTLGRTIAALIFEAEERPSASDVVLDRLADILFIEVVRQYVAQQHDSSFLAAVADSKLSRALIEFHADPGKNWSVQSLADVACMSRSAFADRFQQLTNIAPMHYVIRWRMQHGYHLLMTGNLPIGHIAETCGYQSEESFSKAIRKEFARSPRELRLRKIKEEVASLVSVKYEAPRSTKILYSPAECAALLKTGSLVFIDVRDGHDFDRGHISGAVNIPELYYTLSTTTPDGVSELQDVLTPLFSRAGISGGQTVVFCEDNLSTRYGGSCRGYFQLALFAYPNIGILDGGLERWQAEGYPLTTHSTVTVSSRFNFNIQADELATIDDVLHAVEDPRIKLLDDRDAVEWYGLASAPAQEYGVDFTPRKGRIPGACWIEWKTFMETVDGMSRFKSPERIRALCAQAGLYTDDPIIVYCFKGARSSNTFIALKTAGFRHIKNYLGSWNEWSRSPEAPVMSTVLTP
jgi:thiosulfate/3-mercaptopyruvate sulfurtransferase